ncbi:hypothetical protein QQ045_018856 [Rhodiola kirilowii]
MKLKMGDDSLSSLPDNIIEGILMRMSIRDAIKTCVLSSKWRYRWTKMKNLCFDDSLYADRDPEQWDPMDIQFFISQTLLLHEGPIHRFQLSVLQPGAHMDKWVLYLSRNGIKELVLHPCDGDLWRVPSCLFGCKKLIHLELRHCKISLPKTFKGFWFLKSLSLYRVDIPQEGTEYLISSCPLLETLSLSYINNLELHIDAPRLKYLNLECEFKDIVLLNTPLLISVNVCIYTYDDFTEQLELNHRNTYAKFLGAMRLLERLDGRVYFTKYLSTSHDFGRFPVTFDHLKIIELHQVSFDDIKEIQVIIHLLVSSPFLQTLTLSVSPSLHGSEKLKIVNVDNEQNLAELKLEHLCHVKITDMLANPNELLFVQFLLDRSPVLDSLMISTSLYLETEREKMLIDFLRFKRASTRAEISILLD